MKTIPFIEREFTVAQFAQAIKRTPSRVLQLIKEKKIEATKPQGTRDWWILESQIEAFRALPDGRGRPRKVR